MKKSAKSSTVKSRLCAKTTIAPRRNIIRLIVLIALSLALLPVGKMPTLAAPPRPPDKTEAEKPGAFQAVQKLNVDQAEAEPIVGQVVTPVQSRAVSELPVRMPSGEQREIPSRNLFGATASEEAVTRSRDPLLDINYRNQRAAPPTILNFEGQGDLNNASPPDTTGDVGPNHYVQMVNVTFAIYDKTGALLSGPTSYIDLFSGSGLTACETRNDGHPIVLYDDMADRWMLTQVVQSSGLRQCFAVSQTPDPTGAYNLYQFDMPAFPDAPQVWGVAGCLLCGRQQRICEPVLCARL